uniref:Malonyl-CoA:ACP transacylase (MAT) domain-containing protein n=1 Tax=Alexandrium andersonii TaxID=327968 RepID=A0A7S2J2Y3_9DINO|mmetsp:Transcript_93435/g.209134  ORF Transcript_93435/g.209134 Transcript_93435/m.209134 type:complete len:377 (+) Transcript_93435:3-1133(+)
MRPVPNKVDRKFYGDAVYGITHGYDDAGNPIRGRKELGAQEAAQAEPEAHEPWVVAQASSAPQAVSAVGLLFPGQGSQYVQMMKEVKTKPGVQSMLAIAKDVLDFDLLEVCLSGPDSEFDKPEVLLPCMYVACLAAVEKLREGAREVAERPGALAGLFVGEYTALTTAGVWSFKTGLSLVKAYGEAIAAAVKDGKTGSISVAGIEKGKLAGLCEQAKTQIGGGAVCQINMELFPKGFSCGCSMAALDVLKGLAEKNGALQCKVTRAFGAIHTPAMESVRAVMEEKLKEALPSMRPPRCDVYLNSTGKAIRKGTQPKELVAPLAAQVSSPVLWEKCVSSMITMGVEEFYEVGPSKQLKAMMKRIDPSVWGRTKNVEI